MGKRIAGVAYWYVDGKQLAVRGNLVVAPSPVRREGIAGQDYVHGYSESPIVPFIEGDVSMVDETSPEDLGRVTNATITVELANGKVYALREAWCTDGFQVSTKEGSLKVRFEGTSCEEI